MVSNEKCERCGKEIDENGSPLSQRELFLTTLTQGTIVVEVHEWLCTHCNEYVSYKVARDTIFPAFEYLSYSYELLYKWVELVCYRGISFRMAYETTRSMCDKPTSKALLGTHGHLFDLDTFIDVNPGGRRRANDAFRAFVFRVDLSSPTFTKKLFSCSKCEQKLTECDKNQLGLDEVDISSNATRLRGVVIDGTAAGILKQLPNYKRTKTPISEIRVRARKHLISGHMRSYAVKEFCKLARKAARLAANSVMRERSTISFPLGSNSCGQKGLSNSHLDILRIYTSEKIAFVLR